VVFVTLTIFSVPLIRFITSNFTNQRRNTHVDQSVICVNEDTSQGLKTVYDCSVVEKPCCILQLICSKLLLVNIDLFLWFLNHCFSYVFNSFNFVTNIEFFSRTHRVRPIFVDISEIFWEKIKVIEKAREPNKSIASLSVCF